MGEEIKLTVSSALTGASVWGPATVSGSMELGAFVETVAEQLGVDKAKVVLLNGDDKLMACGTLLNAGIEDGGTVVAAV